MTGLALAWLICYPLFSLLLIRRAALRFGLTMTSILQLLLKPVISGAAMLATIAFMRVVLASQAQPLILLGAGFTGAAMYLLATQISDKQLLRDFKELMAPTANSSS